MRGVTPQKDYEVRIWQFQLTRLMRGVTMAQKYDINTLFISTHTPHARRDDKIHFLCEHFP